MGDVPDVEEAEDVLSLIERVFFFFWLREVEVEREEEEEKKKKTAVIEWLSKRSLAFSSRYFRGALSNSSICDLQWRERVGPRPARQETQGKAVETGSILLAEKAATAQSFSCPVAPSKKKKKNESPPLPPPPQTHVDHGRRQDLVRRQRPQRCLHAVPGRQSDNGRLLGREHRGDLRLDSGACGALRQCSSFRRSVAAKGAKSGEHRGRNGWGAKERGEKERSRARRESERDCLSSCESISVLLDLFRRPSRSCSSLLHFSQPPPFSLHSKTAIRREKTKPFENLQFW